MCKTNPNELRLEERSFKLLSAIQLQDKTKYLMNEYIYKYIHFYISQKILNINVIFQIKRKPTYSNSFSIDVSTTSEIATIVTNIAASRLNVVFHKTDDDIMRFISCIVLEKHCIMCCCFLDEAKRFREFFFYFFVR